VNLYRIEEKKEKTIRKACMHFFPV